MKPTLTSSSRAGRRFGFLGFLGWLLLAAGLPLAPALAQTPSLTTIYPFRESTTLRFRSERTVKAQLRVYNTLGQLVKTLYDQEAPAGRTHEFVLAGQDLAEGLYTCRLQLGDRLYTQRVMLTK